MSLNSSLKRLSIFFLFLSSFAFGQEKEDDTRKLKKVGVLFNNAKQNNFLFSDKDYDYKTNTFKAQLFYSLRKGENWDINLIVQPQFQIAEHQLLNIFFVTPDEPNFEDLRDRYSQKKTISLYAFELGFQLRKELLDSLFFESTLGLGVAYIDVETERLAQGFTFLENLSVGLAYQLKNTEFYLGTNVGHVSNFNIQKPNSGYDLLGFEIGYRIYIN
ncbi:acyloxyacyl hydrolase [Pseudotenacibaculum haliotis]|uniref:Acyloxyacyl hydrolase n=1 Tax=Pseudotenacibaculum haliotis TaxID=1862138 RepID=A0ABW5LUD6_9FLAO